MNKTEGKWVFWVTDSFTCSFMCNAIFITIHPHAPCSSTILATHKNNKKQVQSAYTSKVPFNMLHIYIHTCPRPPSHTFITKQSQIQIHFISIGFKQTQMKFIFTLTETRSKTISSLDQTVTRINPFSLSILHFPSQSLTLTL